MKIIESRLSDIAPLLIGKDTKLTPPLKVQKIKALFNSVCSGKKDDENLPEYSIKAYTLKKLKEINDTPELEELLEIVFNPVHFRKDSGSDLEKAVEEINILIKEDGWSLNLIGDKYICTHIENKDTTDINSSFEGIEKDIITEIKKAKFLIWVAVAWFTNEKIGRVLLQKKREGVSIRIITIDDEINREHGKFVTKYLDGMRILPKGYCGNIMHHKFCIIDLNIVISGSYNWSKKAEFNNETITIIEKKSEAENFAKEFNKLYKENFKKPT